MKIVILIMISAGVLMASFVRDGDVVKDSATNLFWQDDNASKSVRLNFEDAKKHCEGLSLAGHNDWRLPSLLELQSIVDFKEFKPAINKPFQNVTPRLYWSSTIYAGDVGRAWYVYFYDGRIHYFIHANDSYVRCVRVNLTTLTK